MIRNNSLSKKLSRKITLTFLTLLMVTTVILLLMVYLSLNELFEKQLHIWLKVTPENTLPNLIESDYFTITKQVKLLSTTGIFSSFIVYDNKKNIIASFNLNNKKIITNRYIPISDNAGVIWGYYTYTSDFDNFFHQFSILGLIFGILMLPLYLIFNKLINYNLKFEFNKFGIFLNKIEMFSKKLNKLNEFTENLIDENPDTEEQQKINNVISTLVTEIKRSHDKLEQATVEAEKIRAKGELSKIALQVAHDIRSPLITLKEIEKNITYVQEKQRNIIRSAIKRINDIANNLISAYKANDINQTYGDLSQESIALILDEVYLEKVAQYENYNLSIRLQIDKNSYSKFSNINSNELKIIISNLINNSVEAMREDKFGNIEINLGSKKNKLYIEVIDNGCGIPSQLLSKVVQGGISVGKKGGLGLGLLHAIQCIKSWGGSYEIESEVDKGTKLTIHLPEMKPPKWFINEITLMNNSAFIILDDDEYIHELWENRIKETLKEDQKIEIFHYHKSEDFYLDFKKYTNSRYAVDFELFGNIKNGLDIIEELDIMYRAFLVTNRYEDTDIRKKCNSLGVKLLPKGYVNHVLINIQEDNELVVLLDDNQLLIETWQLRAAMSGKNLLTFNKSHDFFDAIIKFNKDVIIYVDCDLKEELSGVEIAEVMYQKGFHNIYITTGYPESKFGDYQWIKGIIGKEPPF